MREDLSTRYSFRITQLLGRLPDPRWKSQPLSGKGRNTGTCSAWEKVSDVWPTCTYTEAVIGCDSNYAEAPTRTSKSTVSPRPTPQSATCAVPRQHFDQRQGLFGTPRSSIHGTFWMITLCHPIECFYHFRGVILRRSFRSADWAARLRASVSAS